jgi:hypothetical protein
VGRAAQLLRAVARNARQRPVPVVGGCAHAVASGLQVDFLFELAPDRSTLRPLIVEVRARACACACVRGQMGMRILA